MRTLVFDTETTGKANFKGELHSQPYIVQLAAILFEDRREVAHFSAITIPEFRGERCKVPAEATAVHGVTEELIDSVGIPYSVALPMFNNLAKRADRLVAHNTEFDDLMIRAAYARIAAPQQVLWDLPKVCTMRSSESVLKLPGKYGYKWPSLAEAHQHFTGEGFEGAHDAMVDVRACARVLFGLEDAGHKLHELASHPMKGQNR